MKENIQKAPRSRGAWLRLGALLCLVLLGGGMLYQRRSVSPAPLSSPAPMPTQMSAAEERTRRETAYDRDIASLERLLQSGAADQDTQRQAAQRMERMIGDHQSELAVEEALHQAGFDPVLVLLQNGALTIMVSSGQLGAEASASILNLCVSHTDISPENIRVMTLEP